MFHRAPIIDLSSAPMQLWSPPEAHRYHLPLWYQERCDHKRDRPSDNCRYYVTRKSRDVWVADEPAVATRRCSTELASAQYLLILDHPLRWILHAGIPCIHL